MSLVWASITGRTRLTEAYPLFGYHLRDYDALFSEKLDLLLKLNEVPHIRWSGRFRPALNGEGVYPRPHQDRLPIWLGVGGTPSSFERAGTLGLPLMVAIIGGTFEGFRPAVDLYRRAMQVAGHPLAEQRVGVHAMGFVADTDEAAREAFFPGWFQAMSTVGRSLPGRQSANGRCQDEGVQPCVGRRVPHHLSDESRCTRNRSHAAIDRVAWHRSRATVSRRTRSKSVDSMGELIDGVWQKMDLSADISKSADMANGTIKRRPSIFRDGSPRTGTAPRGNGASGPRQALPSEDNRLE